jgi:signal transduction histidine kinase
VVTRSIDAAVCDASTAYVLVSEGLRERMMVTLAHDLRGPLSAAKAAAALILRQPADPAVRRWASRVDDNIDRVDRMLRTLLDVSRAGSGARITLQIAPCELVGIVRGAVDTLSLSYGERFKVTAPEVIHGHWSAEALSRAVENLLTNALKYGDPRGSVAVSIERTHDRALLRVHNDGSYIPPEERETIFEAFRRSHEAEDSEVTGWGLGLALARAVAEGHGGSISVDSLPQTGTTFVVNVPVDSRPFQNSPLTPGAARS